MLAGAVLSAILQNVPTTLMVSALPDGVMGGVIFTREHSGKWESNVGGF